VRANEKVFQQQTLMCKTYTTDRLLLRQWKDADRREFTEINNDPDVMRYFPQRYTSEDSNRFVDQNLTLIANEGWGAWAVELIESTTFIGFVGFSIPAQWHPCANHIDIGWRLGKDHWGYGYATEAARFSLRIGFTSLGFNKLVSYTSECNLPSINVMSKIGMFDDGIGFEHPRIEVTSPLRKHVVYRLSKSQWQAKNA